MKTLTLGPYTFDLTQTLKGGMGTLFVGQHILGTPVVLKTTDTPARIDALSLEAQITAALHHQAIIPLYDYGQFDEKHAQHHPQIQAQTPYLVLPYLEDHRPAERTWSTLVPMILEALDALAQIHAQGILHRDIKPDNILFQTNHLTLIDFGVASWRKDNVETRANEGGTPFYMPPEQFVDWHIEGPWTDLYALGCVVYEFIFGIAPFVGASIETIYNLKTKEDLTFPDNSLNPNILNWLKGMLSSAPAGRFQCAAQAASALKMLKEDAHKMSAPQPLAAAWTLSTMDDFGDDFEPITTHTTTLNVQRTLSQTPPIETRRIASICEGLGHVGAKHAQVEGRQNIQSRLWTTLTGVVHTQVPKLVRLEASGGLGKSTLARWLAQTIHKQGFTLSIEARCAPLMQPYEAIIQGLRAALKLSEDHTQWPKQLAWLDFHAPLSMTQRRQLIRALRMDVENREHLRKILTTTLIALARHHTCLVLHLDDVHWSSDAALLCQDLVGRHDCPIFVIACTRPQANTSNDWQELMAHDACQTITFEPLDRQASTALIEQHIRLPNDATNTLIEQSEGHPALIIETLGKWIDDGCLWQDAQGTIQAKPTLVVPNDVSSIYGEQLHALMDDRDHMPLYALHVAATLGVVFEEALLLEALHDDLPFHTFRALQLRDWMNQRQSHWCFTQEDLWQHVRQQARLSDKWPQINKLCALARTTLAKKQHRTDHSPALCLHWIEAGELEQALKILKTFGHTWSPHDSPGVLDRLEQLVQDHPRKRTLMVDILAMRSNISINLGDLQQSRRHIEQALALIKTQDKTAHVNAWGNLQNEYAWLLFYEGHLTESLDIAQKTLTVQDQLEDNTCSNFHQIMSSIYQRLDQPERALKHIEQAISRQPSQSHASSWLAYDHASLLLSLERFEEATQITQQALEQMKAQDDLVGEASCLTLKAEWCHMKGQVTQAIVFARQAMTAYRESNDIAIYLALDNLGRLLLEENHLDEARQHLLEAKSAHDSGQYGVMAYPVDDALLLLETHAQRWHTWDEHMQTLEDMCADDPTVLEDETLCDTLAQTQTLLQTVGQRNRQRRLSQLLNTFVPA